MVRRFEDILERVAEHDPNSDQDLLRRAYVFSAREHRNQKRRSGEPYLVHPLEVAYILAELRLDTASVVAGLLHDVVEDTLTTIDNVADYFGRDVAAIVEGVTKISKLNFQSTEQAQAENLRKMILAMTHDVRVILVKLADRIHNMRTLEHLKPEKRERIARETLDIFAPIANRLGIGKVKTELEDLSFRYIDPLAYRSLESALAARRKVSEEFIEETRKRLEQTIAEQGIEAEISGRVKHLYSIYRKMRAQKIGVDEVYDYVAFRVLTGSVKDCYGVLGIVHSSWRPVPGRIKDYIAMPKPNLYQSLHTSVMSDRGQPFEVQIRTHEMHAIAEEGIAAHWQYKEGAGDSDREQDRVAWLRQILDWQQDLQDPREFLELVKVDLYPEEVYAFTPKGEVLCFPRGATPIDFAYRIHTEVGNHCTGAKVNGRIVPLKYELENGDIVEIMTQPARTPSRDWLALARTSKARSKIRAWINQSERESALALGREMIDKEFRKYKLSPRKLLEGENLAQAMEKLGFKNLEDFQSSVGYGKSSAHQLVSALVPDTQKLEERPDGRVKRAVKRALGMREKGVKVQGLDDALITLARCCNPVRGEDIVGYITRGKGVSVHAVHCPNVAQLMFDTDRRIGVEWGSDSDGSTTFDVSVAVDVEDQPGLLAKIVSAISDESTNIKNLEANAETTGSETRVLFVFSVNDRKHMERVFNRIRQINGVRDVVRVPAVGAHNA
ncbi:GTP pyrophosphokinase [Acidobacteria bacterium Mor1]|nr:GTP pyrophosphokinase [Acidobacteria bacterium Mor1]